MSTTTIREYYTDLLTSNNITFVTEGENYEHSVRDTIVRVKIIPRETTNATLGVTGKKLLAGLVSMEIIAPRAGLSTAETLASTIIDLFVPGSHTLSDGHLIIYSTWVEASREEPAHIRLPILSRYEQFR